MTTDGEGFLDRRELRAFATETQRHREGRTGDRVETKGNDSWGLKLDFEAWCATVFASG